LFGHERKFRAQHHACGSFCINQGSIRGINAQADIHALRISVHQQCMKIYVACIVDLR
jgi:hypothetical protein